jgi:hypothetical protein
MAARMMLTWRCLVVLQIHSCRGLLAGICDSDAYCHWFVLVCLCGGVDSNRLIANAAGCVSSLG